MSVLCRVVVHIVVPIVLGACIYVLWRDRALWVFDWLSAAGLSSVVTWSRAVAAPAAAWLPGWCLHSLPDGLWVYAVTASALLVWRDAPAPLARRAWGSVGLVLGAGSELGQALSVVPGTFDVIDLACCVVAAALAVCCLRVSPSTLQCVENPS